MNKLVEQLRGWATDWNGERMVRGEPPRDGIHCDVLIDAANEIEKLRAVVLNIQSLAKSGFPIDSAKLETRCRLALSDGQ